MADLAELLSQYRSEQCPKAAARLAGLFDDGSYNETGRSFSAPGRAPTVMTASGRINGLPAYAFAFDSSVDGGAFDEKQAAKVASLYDLAARNGVPIVGIYDSKGAYVNDGAAALNGYSLVLSKAAEVSGVVPVIAIADGVCSGSLALCALTADILVMTGDAELYIDVNRKLDSKAAAEMGLAAGKTGDISGAWALVREYLSHMPSNNLSGVGTEPYGGEKEEAVPTAKEIAVEGSVTELYKDFGTEVCTVLSAIETPNGSVSGGICCIGSGGTVTGEGLAKAARFARLCDAFSLPIVTVIDCEGTDCSDAGAYTSFVRAAAAFAEAGTPKIAVVKKAVGAVFTAFAGKNVSADTVIALADSLIAPIAPLTAAEFLSHDSLKGSEDTSADRKALADKYAKEQANAFCAAACGAADEVCETSELREKIGEALAMAAGKRLAKRIPRKHSTL
ncbi:MAG: carboxyl transferase [Oscillospiraceae bacterium]|nr:carboxyl transferase [Oscillospiraceae bacterium]